MRRPFSNKIFWMIGSGPPDPLQRSMTWDSPVFIKASLNYEKKKWWDRNWWQLFLLCQHTRQRKEVPELQTRLPQDQRPKASSAHPSPEFGGTPASMPYHGARKDANVATKTYFFWPGPTSFSQRHQDSTCGSCANSAIKNFKGSTRVQSVRSNEALETENGRGHYRGCLCWCLQSVANGCTAAGCCRPTTTPLEIWASK